MAAFGHKFQPSTAHAPGFWVRRICRASISGKVNSLLDGKRIFLFAFLGDSNFLGVFAVEIEETKGDGVFNLTHLKGR